MAVHHGSETQRHAAGDWRREIPRRHRAQFRQRMRTLRFGEPYAVFLLLGKRAHVARDIRSALLNGPREKTLRERRRHQTVSIAGAGRLSRDGHPGWITAE